MDPFKIGRYAKTYHITLTKLYVNVCIYIINRKFVTYPNVECKLLSFNLVSLSFCINAVQILDLV